MRSAGGRLASAQAGPVTGGSSRAPALVRDVVRSPGDALDGATRAFMEPRFGRDFSDVRVHTDVRAGESALAIGAAAYTFGRHIAFGAGRYAPAAPAGQRLLAHELTHVVQGGGGADRAPAPMTIGTPGSAIEHEAEAVSAAIRAGAPATHVGARADAAGRVHRAGIGELRLAEGLEAERTARTATAKDVAPMGGKIVLDAEKTAIEAILKALGQPSPSPLAYPTGTKFLLHDTSAPVGATRIAEQVAAGRGPLGPGVGAWVPRDTAASLARPSFFEPRRPTTTEYEKAVELFKEPADAKLKAKDQLAAWKGRRDDLFREVWNSAKATERTAAMDEALKGQGLTAAEIDEVKNGNLTKAKAKRAVLEDLPPIADQLKTGSTTEVRTAGAWMAEAVCKRVDAAGAAAVADTGKATALETACKNLGPLFVFRDVRTQYTATVEIVQVGTKDPTKGSQDTCNPKNPNVRPMPSPPYSDNQYGNIAKLYLRAALTAGRFPGITTHFLADAFIGGHCDPRCFDLGKLYGTIAALIGHPAGCTYGPVPSYGRASGTSNIWWDDTICGGAHP